MFPFLCLEVKSNFQEWKRQYMPISIVIQFRSRDNPFYNVVALESNAPLFENGVIVNVISFWGKYLKLYERNKCFMCCRDLWFCYSHPGAHFSWKAHVTFGYVIFIKKWVILWRHKLSLGPFHQYSLFKIWVIYDTIERYVFLINSFLWCAFRGSAPRSATDSVIVEFTLIGSSKVWLNNFPQRGLANNV